MPNYSDTVRCSHCGHKGHNKATCEHLTERYKDLAIQYGKDGGGAHFRMTYERRSKLNLDTGEPISKKKMKPTRKNKQATCSYCNYNHGEESVEAWGHTRRTCSQLKEDKAWLLAVNAQHRKNVHAALSRDGYGKGFMLGVHAWDSDCHEWATRISIATKIDWNEVNVFDNGEDAIVSRSATQSIVKSPLPYLRHPEIDGAWIRRFSSPSPESFWRMKGFQTDGPINAAFDSGRWWGVSKDRNYRIGTKGVDPIEGGGANTTYSASGSAWDSIPAEYVDGDGKYVKEYFKSMTAKRSTR
jgi:hypothetical protein